MRHNALKHGFTAAEITLPTSKSSSISRAVPRSLRGRAQARLNLKTVREENYSNLSGVLSDDALYTDTYGKMSRYEGRFERTFNKALKDLQRLQALRAAVSDSGNGLLWGFPFGFRINVALVIHVDQAF